jgi:hypothetical protein
MGIDMEETGDSEGVLLDTAIETDFRKVEGIEAENTILAITNHRTSDRLGLPPPSEEYPTDPTKFQDFQDAPDIIRKMWLSIDQKLDTLIRHIGKKETQLKNSDKGLVIRLSRSLAEFQTGKPLKMGDTLHLRFSPPTFPPFTIDIAGRVSGIADPESGGTGLKLYKIEFVALNIDDRELLISYIFKRQREILRGYRDGDAPFVTEKSAE